MITQKALKAARARLEINLMLEFIVGSALPADHRLALLQQQMSSMDIVAADDLLDRVLGRLGYDDPLIVLMSS